ncbi:efflux RND transporter periplasmic adaptor subunit [Candidatus Binatus sp.]|uniref:efflux RND transporter periplasmic adaptor subunit n=1 Tax=Candidatus Binatus sp. TaxID=2811406 RepID=UPI003BB1F7AA
MTTTQRATVDVVHPRQGDIAKTIEMPGDVVGFYEAALHAKVTGYLKSISVDKGDSVKTGQVLAEIEVPELRSNLARSQASLEIERITYERLRKVQQSDPRLISQQDVDMAYAKYREAQAAVATLQTMFGYTRIIAPFDGVITGRFADPGALIRAGGGDIGVDETSGMISPGATEGAGGHREGGGPILTLAEIDKLRVYIYVPEASYPFIHVGTPASLRFDEFPDRVFNGTVARYASSLDLATRTMLTEVDIDNPKRLVYPRSYAHVTIELVRHPDALSVPASAIQGSRESARVLVVNDGRLVEVPVKTGINNGSYVEVTSGLSPQSLVVATYSNNLTRGQQVDCRIQNGDGQATSAAAQSSD